LIKKKRCRDGSAFFVPAGFRTHTKSLWGLGKPEAFAQWLKQTLPEQAFAPSATCGLDGCSF